MPFGNRCSFLRPRFSIFWAVVASLDGPLLSAVREEFWVDGSLSAITLFAEMLLVRNLFYLASG